MHRGKLLFLTPYIQEGRGNATTSLRLKTGYEQAGYEVNMFAYTEEST